jgi:hypothetical protein
VKRITVDADIGHVNGRGHVISVLWDKNPTVQVDDVVKVSGMPGYFSIRGIELMRGAHGKDNQGSLIIRKYEGDPYAEVPEKVISTLDEAKAYVLAHRDDGVECPCCGKSRKVYERTIYSGMARFLIWLVREYQRREELKLEGGLWVDSLEGPPQRGGDFAKMAHWGLIEQMANDDETKRTSRFWRPTAKGAAFVHGLITISKRVRLFDNVVIGFSEERFDIRDALGKKFDYKELMEQ